MTRSFLGILTAGRELPPGHQWGFKTTSPDGRTYPGHAADSDRYRWPLIPGAVVEDPAAQPSGSACPTAATGGLCVAETVAGAMSGGYGLATILVVAFAPADVLDRDAGEGKLRVRRVVVVDVVDGHRLVSGQCAGAYLRGANLRGANLRGANLGGANLGGANLGGADLGGADLTRANLPHADLGGAYLGGANLTDAYLGGAYLARANLTDAYLGGAYLGGADLGGADLPHANLTDANLTRANLARANLTGANLAGANLTDANLTDAVGYKP